MPAMPAIDAKVGIGRENDRVRKRFCHAHKASIGKAHGHVHVLLQEHEYGIYVVVQVEGGNQGSTAKQSAESGRSANAEKMECLRQDGFAGAPR